MQYRKVQTENPVSRLCSFWHIISNTKFTSANNRIASDGVSEMRYSPDLIHSDDLSAAVVERLYEVRDAVHGRLTKAVDREAVWCLADVRCLEQLHRAEFVVVGADISREEVLALSVRRQHW